MTFSLQVKIDPGSTVPVLDKVHASLAAVESLEAKTAITSAATGKALAAMATSAKPEAIDASTAALKRENDMLEKIRKPMRDYVADQDALQALYQKNKISAKEYTDQVAKLNEQFEKAPKKEEHKGFEVEGSIGKSVAGQFGEAGNLASGAATGALEAGAIAAVAVEVGRLGDEYTNLANKAVRFVDVGHDTNQILDDQMSLSREVHGSLEQTVELYSQMREGTDELNYSYQDQITATKSLAQEVQLSGKGLDQSTGLMQRLAFAFESGTLSSRELKGMLRDFPALGETLRESFGKTSKELMDMAKHGTLAPQMILDALIEKAPEIEERFGKMAETSAMKWQHFKDEVTLSIGGAIPSMDQMVHKMAELKPPIERAKDEMAAFQRQLEKTLSPAALIAAHLREIADAQRNASTYASIQERQIAAEEEAAKASAQKHKDEAYDRKIKKEEAAALAEYNKEIEEERKILDDVNGTTEESIRAHTALEALVRKHTITTAQYNAELDKMAIRAANPELLKLVNDATSSRQPKDKQLAGEIQQRAQQSAEEGYANSIDTKAPIDKWKDSISQLNDFYARGVVNAEQYKVKKREIDEEFSKNQYSKTELEDHKRLTDKWKVEIEEYKKHTAQMVSALKPFEDGILQMVDTGKVNFQGMIDSWRKSIEAAALHKGIEKLASGLLGLFEGKSVDLSNPNGPADGGGHATGGSYTAPPGGGTDSHRVTFRMSPNETAYFVPQGQQQAAQAQSAGPTVVKIVNQHDTRGELLDAVHEGAIDAHIINVMRKNARAIRSLIG